ncbi:MAG: F0F1 ATP synthase subunit gamma [Anaerolineae bacterium]
MATPREIRRRIRSVSNIAKVTGALEAVSASKVRRAQQAAVGTRDYANAARQILFDIAARSEGGLSHPLLDERESVRTVTIVLITSDRGLAGPYNTNIVRKVLEFEDTLEGKAIRYITVGRKGRDLIRRHIAALEEHTARGEAATIPHIVFDFSEKLPPAPKISDITSISRAAIDDFLSGVVDEVYIAYTDFRNTLSQVPRVRRLLPLMPTEADIVEGEVEMKLSQAHALYIFEPDAQSILDEILPRFTELQLYQAVLESLASEHSARMVAMRSATENANALVDDLTLTYNKARQLAITSEMLDIVGGANALDEA